MTLKTRFIYSNSGSPTAIITPTISTTTAGAVSNIGSKSGSETTTITNSIIVPLRVL